MSLIEKIHGQCVFGRRVRVIAGHLAAMLPPDASVLDVGCGDGSLAKLIQDLRPDVRMRGIDVLVRPQTAIPVEPFDGTHICATDGSYDVVMFVDVLHHTNDPLVLLREARRVARHSVLLKDHTRNGLLAGPTLRFMDSVGNARHGVALPYKYWRREQWQTAFRELGLQVEVWQQKLGLYPAWANWLFGRSLHFIARAGIPKKS
jgi:SAM-dependent methyltransferase